MSGADVLNRTASRANSTRLIERRSRWSVYRDHLMAASVGAEYIAACIFFGWGLYLFLCTITGQAPPEAINPALRMLSRQHPVLHLLMTFLGAAHVAALLTLSDDTWVIFFRKLPIALEWAQLVGVLTPTLVLLPYGWPGGLLAALQLLPLIGLLTLGLFRQR